jgi:DNA-binding PucR family transcriptional regulator
MNEIQAIVDALAAELGRPVEVDDQRFRAIAHSAHSDDDIDYVRLQSILQREAPKEATGWLASLGVQDAAPHLRIPGNDELGMAPRLCIPLRFNGSLLGYMWLLDSPVPLDDGQIELSTRAASEMAAELFRLRRLERVGRYQESEVVRQILLGDGDVDEAVAGWRRSNLASASCYSCLTLAVRGLDGASSLVQVAAALDDARRMVAPRRLATALDTDRGIAVLAHDDAGEPERRAQQLYAQLCLQLSDQADMQAAVGVSAARRDLAELRAAYLDASLALDVALSGAGASPVSLAEHLGAYGVIATIVNGRGDLGAWGDVLGGLADAANGAALLETLETYLEQAGDAKVTADKLFLHRSSLYNRLHRIEGLTGRDLHSGDARLELHLALRLWRLAGSPQIRQLSSSPPGTRDS